MKHIGSYHLEPNDMVGNNGYACLNKKSKTKYVHPYPHGTWLIKKNLCFFFGAQMHLELKPRCKVKRNITQTVGCRTDLMMQQRYMNVESQR